MTASLGFNLGAISRTAPATLVRVRVDEHGSGDRCMARQDYRIYKVDVAGRIVGSPVIYPAEGDVVALKFAQLLASDWDGASVWQAGRLVQEVGRAKG